MTYPRLRFMHKDQMGFTLIEMLVVLALIGLITGGITAAIMQVL
ncbi:MAG: type II secretion system protein, partial [Dehalococcoidia bacterium]|nr:type II secretion system protein [Dehalococcoidia bacterium]